MRWFVEISQLGASEGQKHKWCIEAAGWQPALKEARSIRGEDGPLGGFSIELLDDGARAVDPGSRLRYVIRSAPDDAPLTHVNKVAVGEAPKVEAPEPEAPEAEEPEAEEPEAEEPQDTSTEEAASAEEAADEGSDDVDIPVDEGAEGGELPDYEVLQTREEEPSEGSPLTYRELVIAVAEDTDDEAIEQLLYERFAALKEDLAGVEQGIFINVAIFDHVFSGKPQRRPRATLAWKDWRGEPVVRFPAQDGSASPSSFPAPTSASTPVPLPSVPAPGLTAQTASEPPPAPAKPKSEPPPAPAPAKPKSEPPPAPKAPSVPPPTEAPPTEAASTEPAPTMAAPTMAAPTEVSPPRALSEPPAAKPIVPAPEPARISSAPEVPQRSSSPMSAPPKTMPAAALSRREPFIPPTKTANEASPRVNGEDLIIELFEACGDIQFYRDSLEGAEFILDLTLQKLPSEVALLSLFDINRREFVVVRQAGGARSLVLSRLPERAPLAQAAMRKGSAIVVPSAAKDPRAQDDRFRTLGVEAASLMVAPVEQSGRYLGLIELVNPVDGKPFTEGDGHALTYIGEQYAAFVAERGPLLDPDTVIERHQRR